MARNEAGRSNTMLLGVLLLLLCLSSVSLAQWPRFHGNPLNTGVVPGAEGRAGEFNEFWTFSVLSYTNSSPALADLDDDGLLEVVIGSKDEALFVLNGEDGSILWSYPLPDSWNGGSPVVADIDGDLQPEVVFASDDTLFTYEGESGAVIWQIPIDGNSAMSPCAADLDGNGTIEVVFSGNYETRAFDGQTGDVLWTQEDCWVMTYGSVVAEDTDLDGSAEVMTFSGVSGARFCLLDGADGSFLWSTTIPCSIGVYTPAPAFADLDNDAYPEIVSCTGNNDLYVMDPADGSIHWSEEFPGSSIWSSPCLMDINGNDSLEIVVGLYGGNQLLAYSCTGDLIWTTPVEYHPLGTPAVADIDGDQSLEIIQTSANAVPPYAFGYLQIFDAETGVEEYGRLFTGMIGSSPAIGDLDGDGYFDFVFGGHDGLVYAMRNEPGGIEPDPGDDPHGIDLSPNPNPFHSSVNISFELAEAGMTSVTVYDLSGRAVRTLEHMYLAAGQHSVIWDGREGEGADVSAGLYVCRVQSGGISETTGLCLLR